MRRWKPSKTAKKEFAQKMNEIDDFCRENGIHASASSDSYYFTINERKYRVSNHTIKASDKGMYAIIDGERTKVRDSYHEKDEDLICITASKTRIIQIFNDLKAGVALDKRGFRR